MTVPPIVRRQSYGKSQIRLSRIQREGTRHDFIELTAWIELGGDFDASYAAADNWLIVPTDTIKNTVYVLAKRHGVGSIEQFAQVLGQHMLTTYAHVDRVDVRCRETPWSRLTFGGEEHPHAFVGGSSERYTCELVATRDASSMTSGFRGLEVLKTTASGFVNYLRDEYTTLEPTEDRIFATSIQASWPCGDLTADWTQARQTIRGAMLDVFVSQYSKSVQHTLYEMARSAFAACSRIDEITITMPNRHHLLANLVPFKLKNPNEVFEPTSAPFGKIGATIARADAEKPA